MLSCEKDLSVRSLPKHSSGNFIDLSSNDYLGLSKNPQVIIKGCEAAQRYGAGTTGSRLLSGNNDLFELFEEMISFDKNMEASLIFNSGYQANIGVLEALANKDTCIVFDKLNHASMYQGVFSSGAKLLRYRHLDYSHLEDTVKNIGSKNIIIASETVFGMDGDMVDLQILSDIADKYGALLYLDEAHATGLYGKNGYGLSTNFSLNKEKTIIMGTFSKAVGSSGAYIVCDNFMKRYLIQKCKSFIYSTALSPFCVGAAMCSWEMIGKMEKIRSELLDKASFFRERVGGIGAKTNIVPFLCKNVLDMLKMRRILSTSGVQVSYIRPPTSPTPRIRMAVCSHHSEEDLLKVASLFQELLHD